VSAAMAFYDDTQHLLDSDDGESSNSELRRRRMPPVRGVTDVLVDDSRLLGDDVTAGGTIRLQTIGDDDYVVAVFVVAFDTKAGSASTQLNRLVDLYLMSDYHDILFTQASHHSNSETVHCHRRRVILGVPLAPRPPKNYLNFIANKHASRLIYAATAVMNTAQLNSTENYGRRCLTPLSPHRNYILS